MCSIVQGTLRPVDVQFENVTRDIERLGVFCVKDTGQCKITQRKDVILPFFLSIALFTALHCCKAA